MTEPHDPRLELEEVIARFGEVKEEFRPSPANLVAGIILGVLMALGGGLVTTALISAPFAGRDLNVKQIGFLVVLALFLPAGVGLIVWSLRMFSYRLLVCASGLVEVRRGVIRTWRWDEIRQVAEHEQKKNRHTTYTVSGQSSEDLVVTANTVSRVNRLVKILRAETEKRDVPWNKTSEW